MLGMNRPFGSRTATGTDTVVASARKVGVSAAWSGVGCRLYCEGILFWSSAGCGSPFCGGCFFGFATVSDEGDCGPSCENSAGGATETATIASATKYVTTLRVFMVLLFCRILNASSDRFSNPACADKPQTF